MDSFTVIKVFDYIFKNSKIIIVEIEMTKPKKRFREILSETRIPITYEIGSPRGYKVSQYIQAISSFRDKLSAVNIPDNPLATLKISSIAYANVIMNSLGIEVIPHVTCRDRNLLALQSDILGAYLLGIRNLFIIGGDRASGKLKDLKQVWEVGPLQFCEIVKMMNDGYAYCGEFVEMDGKTNFFVGGALIFSRENEVDTLLRKIKAGFDFFQSQITFNVENVLKFFEEVEKRDLHLSTPILIGLTPISSKQMLERIVKIPYVEISEELRGRLKRSRNIAEESVKLCLEIADELKSNLSYKYKLGFHVMPLGQDEIGGKIVEGLGG